MRYEDSMKGVADQIIKEQQRASKIKNNPEEFHWHDEYATLNFFRFICKNIGNLRNGEIEKMVTRLKIRKQWKTMWMVLFGHLIMIRCSVYWWKMKFAERCVKRINITVGWIWLNSIVFQGLKDEESCWREIISSNSVFNE